jgi:hypothetical protein
MSAGRQLLLPETQDGVTQESLVGHTCDQGGGSMELIKAIS